mgnify:CR=1 FL=1
MPHQCVKCNKLFEDGSKNLLTGCNSCGSKFFFFIRKEHLEEAEEKIENLSLRDKEKLEKDVFEMIGIEDDKPVILDFESIRTLSPGKFEVDIRHLFQREPLIYKLANGKYIIDLASTFEMRKKK